MEYVSSTIETLTQGVNQLLQVSDADSKVVLSPTHEEELQALNHEDERLQTQIKDLKLKLDRSKLVCSLKEQYVLMQRQNRTQRSIQGERQKVLGDTKAAVLTALTSDSSMLAMFADKPQLITALRPFHDDKQGEEAASSADRAVVLSTETLMHTLEGLAGVTAEQIQTYNKKYNDANLKNQAECAKMHQLLSADEQTELGIQQEIAGSALELANLLERQKQLRLEENQGRRLKAMQEARDQVLHAQTLAAKQKTARLQQQDNKLADLRSESEAAEARATLSKKEHAIEVERQTKLRETLQRLQEEMKTANTDLAVQPPTLLRFQATKGVLESELVPYVENSLSSSNAENTTWPPTINTAASLNSVYFMNIHPFACTEASTSHKSKLQRLAFKLSQAKSQIAVIKRMEDHYQVSIRGLRTVLILLLGLFILLLALFMHTI